LTDARFVKPEILNRDLNRTERFRPRWGKSRRAKMSRIVVRTLAPLFVLSVLCAAAPLDDATRELSRGIFQQLVEINTTDSAGSTTRAAEAMQKRFLDAGFPASDAQLLVPEGRPRKGNLVVRLRAKPGATGKPLLIIAHLDVVEARRSDWTTDPFRFIEKDGYFYGRGTQDMKAADAIAVTTLLRFRKEDFVPSRDIILALTADEEGGTANGVDWLLKNHRELVNAGMALNPDAGGMMFVHGKPAYMMLEASEKTYADFEVSATNPGGHSSLPVPDNAIYRVTDALARLEKSPFPFELNPVTRAWFEKLSHSAAKEQAADMQAILRNPPDPADVARLSADPLYNATMRTTCVPTRLAAGHANNALPQSAQAIVNCRILPGHSPEEVRQDLVRIFADPKVMVRYIESKTGRTLDHAPETTGFPPVAPPPEILKPLERITDEMWSGAPVIPEMETGASDSVHTIAAGIPTYGVSGVSFDHDDIRAHGKDERLRTTSFYNGVEFFHRYLKAITQ
jgi:acetylornithine deacetylase/succinyl-diaminopimelate desuccinylase-like protein